MNRHQRAQSDNKKKAKDHGIIVRRIIGSFLIILGLAIILYPQIAQYVNNKNATRLLEDYFAQGPSQENGSHAPGTFMEYLDEEGNVVIVEIEDPGANGGGPAGPSGPAGNKAEIFGSIRIPKLGLELPIYTGSTSANLNKGVAHLEGTSLPIGGKSTHSVLCGHNGDITNEWFTHIDQLKPGDLFYIRTREQTLTYRVKSTAIISPEDTSDLYIKKGEDLVTLLTCTRDGKMRLIVTGERVVDG